MLKITNYRISPLFLYIETTDRGGVEKEFLNDLFISHDSLIFI